MTYSQGDDARIDSLVFKPGIQSLNEKQIFESGLTLIYVDSILPSSFKKLNEIKGLIISDYQNKLEKDWIKSWKKNIQLILTMTFYHPSLTIKAKFSQMKKNIQINKKKVQVFLIFFQRQLEL